MAAWPNDSSTDQRQATEREPPAWWSLAITALICIAGFFALSYFLHLFDNPTFLYLKLLAFTGGVGGLVSGFIQGDRRLVLCSYEPPASVRCGSLADVLIGIGGAWGIFFVLARSMRLTTDDQGLLTLVGLGVVAGFSARALLAALSNYQLRLVGEAARAAVKDEVKGEVSAAKTEVKEEVRAEVSAVKAEVRSVAKETAGVAVEEVKQAITHSTQRYTDLGEVNLILDLVDSGSVTGAGARRLLEAAERSATSTTRKSGGGLRDHLKLANVKKRLALLTDTAPEQKDALLGEAIDLCSTAIDIDSSFEGAYFNRACYRALRGEDVPRVIQDMERAIELLPENKQLFHDEPDLDGYKQKPEVAALLE